MSVCFLQSSLFWAEENARIPLYCLRLKTDIVQSEYKDATVHIALLLFSAMSSLPVIEE